MPQFVLLLRDNGSFPTDISPEEIQAIIEKYGEWMARVKALGGQKLRDQQGRVLTRNGKGIQMTDGPFAEAKEVVGGYILVEAPDYDAAARLCHDCPHLEFGSIEIREVEPS